MKVYLQEESRIIRVKLLFKLSLFQEKIIDAPEIPPFQTTSVWKPPQWLKQLNYHRRNDLKREGNINRIQHKTFVTFLSPVKELSLGRNNLISFGELLRLRMERLESIRRTKNPPYFRPKNTTSWRINPRSTQTVSAKRIKVYHYNLPYGTLRGPWDAIC